MRHHTDQELEERYDKLPEEVRARIYGPEYANIIQAIGKSRQLHIDKIETLNFLVSEVALGFVTPDEFPDVLIEELGITHDEALAITTDLNEKIFLPIREYLKEGPSAKTAPPVIEKSPAAPAIDRAAALQEIEEPAPGAPVFVAAPLPKAPVVTPPPHEPVAPVAPPAVLPAEPQPNIAAQKLEEPTTTTIQNVNVGRDRSLYKIDPYRELPE